MKPRYLSIVVLAALVVGCSGGGGGSGGAEQGGGTNQPGGGAAPPPDGGGSSGGGSSTGTSSAKIVFPWRSSSALGDTVIVRGTASDPDGVASVTINGVVAAVTSGSGGGSTKPAPDSSVQALTHAQLASDHESDEVEWSVEVELEPGDNELAVAVEDTTGDVTADADEAQVKYWAVPNPFTLDGDDPRLLGWSRIVTESGETNRLVEFDHSLQQQTVYPELHDVGFASCFRSPTDEFLYLMLADEDLWRVYSFDLTTRERTLVSEIPPELLIAGPGFSTGPLLMQLVCGGVHEHAYLLASYWEEGATAKSRVLDIELSGSASMLTETDPDESPLWFARRIALANEALVSFYDIDAAAPLTRIALDDGARTEVAPSIAVGGLAIAAPLEHGRVYVTTFDGVEEVQLTEPPTKRNVSAVGPEEPLHFSNADSIGVDLVNNRLIVGDGDLDVLIAVDLATGERSTLLSRNIGAGPPMITPRSLALTADGTTVYVADDGGNAPERLFEVDLTTGDRRVIGQIHEEGINRSIAGLALDEENGHAYVSRFDGGTVLRIDLETEAVTAITSDADGLLEHVSDVVLDADGQRLLVADIGTDAIVAVDIVSHQKQLISRAGGRGEGEAFATITSLTPAGDGTSLYAADQAMNRILRVDLETGDREVVETTCAMDGPETLQRVVYDETHHELLILADDIYSFDLETSACTHVPTGVLALDVRLTRDGQILAAGFNAVMQIDGESGNVVLVSQ